MQKSIFKHEKNHIKMLHSIIVNIVLATIMYLGVNYWSQQNPEVIEIAYWFEKGYFAVLLVLIAFALFFLLSKKSFYIAVDKEFFEVKEPLFADFTWKVKVADIIEIDQKTDSQADYSRVDVILRDGSKRQLTINHIYDRSGLYDALRKVNPSIKTPQPTKFRVPGL